MNLILDRTTLNYRSSTIDNHLICLLTSDETHHDICTNLRDRLQSEQHHTVEIAVTSSCESLDQFISLIDRSSICIFCVNMRMKTDNLSHFVHRYMSLQPHPIPLLAILIDNDCEFEGSWIENLTLMDMTTIADEISRHFDQVDDHEIRLPSRTSDGSTLSRTHTISPVEFRQHHSRTFKDRPVPNWSNDDVSEWCEATQGSFETLQPLVMRLNGSALVHLAEILSIEPASMYHSLNEELIQRTGTSVPLTEYVSLRSELQQLLIQKQNPELKASNPTSPVVNDSNNNNSNHNNNNNNSRKKRWKKSRLCTIL